MPPLLQQLRERAVAARRLRLRTGCLRLCRSLAAARNRLAAGCESLGGCGRLRLQSSQWRNAATACQTSSCTSAIAAIAVCAAARLRSAPRYLRPPCSAAATGTDAAPCHRLRGRSVGDDGVSPGRRDQACSHELSAAYSSTDHRSAMSKDVGQSFVARRVGGRAVCSRQRRQPTATATVVSMINVQIAN